MGYHHLRPDQRKNHDGDTHPVDRQADQFFIGRKDAGNPFGFELRQQKRKRCDEGCKKDRQPKSFLHTVNLARSVIISHNRLHPLIQPHHNHEKHKCKTIDDAVGSDSQIAALSLQTVIDQNHNHTRSQMHQERSHTDSQYVFDDADAWLEHAFPKM